MADDNVKLETSEGTQQIEQNYNTPPHYLICCSSPMQTPNIMSSQRCIRSSRWSLILML